MLSYPDTQSGLPLGAGQSRFLSNPAYHQARKAHFKRDIVTQGTAPEVERAQKAFKARRVNSAHRNASPSSDTSPNHRVHDSRVIDPKADGAIWDESASFPRSKQDILGGEVLRNTVPEAVELDGLEGVISTTQDLDNGNQVKGVPVSGGMSPEECYTPSEALLYSLGSLSQLYTTYKDFSIKIDLSHSSPFSIARYGRTRSPTSSQPQPGQDNGGPFFPTIRSSLPRLLAEYLRSCWPSTADDGDLKIEPRDNISSEQALRTIFSESNVTFIRTQGYTPEDLISWAWIITAKTTDKAVGRLMAISRELSSDLSQPRLVPEFVFLFLLRRKNWNARSLKLMIMHGWDRLEGRLLSQRQQLNSFYDREQGLPYGLTSQSASHLSMSKRNTVIMIIRLLRHARKVWPESCVSIAAMLTRHERTSSVALHKRQPIAELTFLYNTMLTLLALPASMYPFLSISAQQQAQFMLLRRMNEYDPPLTVDREGYRAVTRVQLAHKKTMQERDWASLKAKSWPPWKEDKIRFDIEKDAQYGTSRAGQAVKQSEEAGYAVQEWETAAEILAGWDTDQTPTIQTRMLQSRPIMSRRRPTKISEEKSTLEPTVNRNIWAARIQATRTVDEAWACFLAFQTAVNRDGSPGSMLEVYHAMAEKLVYDQRRMASPHADNISPDTPEPDDTLPLPGDGKEVYEKPGPREALHVPSSPPAIDTFFDMMLQKNMKLSPRLLALFLLHAKSWKMGLHYLNASYLPKDLVRDLLIGDPTPVHQPLGDEVMPPVLFAALIQFLGRFAQNDSHKDLPVVHLPGTLSACGAPRPRINPLAQACKLMNAYKPRHRPTWNSLLWILARDGVSLKTSVTGSSEDFQGITAWKAYAFDDRIQGMLAWKSITDVVNRMREIGIDLDLSGFRHVCIGFEKALRTRAELIDDPDFENMQKYLRFCSVLSLKRGVPYIKRLFKAIVSGESDSKALSLSTSGVPMADYMLPRLLQTPSPAQVHPFIRVLGLSGDHSGLMEVVEWMAHFAPELQIRADEVMNGKRMLRRCLTAAALFLEERKEPPDERKLYDGKGYASTFFVDNEVTIRTMRSESTQSTDDESVQTLVTRLRQVIDDNPDWGGWPTDEEMGVYAASYRTV